MVINAVLLPGEPKCSIVCSKSFRAHLGKKSSIIVISLLNLSTLNGHTHIEFTLYYYSAPTLKFKKIYFQNERRLTNPSMLSAIAKRAQ